MNRIYLFVLFVVILSACSVLSRERSQTEVVVYEIYKSEYGINYDRMLEITSDEEEKMLDSISQCLDAITVNLDSGKLHTDEKPIRDIENISELSLVYMKERGMGVSDDSAQIQS